MALSGVRESLAGFTAIKGTLVLKVTRVLEASDLALSLGCGHSRERGLDGEPVKLAGHNAGRACVVNQTALGASSSTTPGEPTRVSARSASPQLAESAIGDNERTPSSKTLGGDHAEVCRSTDCRRASGVGRFLRAVGSRLITLLVESAFGTRTRESHQAPSPRRRQGASTTALHSPTSSRPPARGQRRTTASSVPR